MQQLFNALSLGFGALLWLAAVPASAQTDNATPSPAAAAGNTAEAPALLDNPEESVPALAPLGDAAAAPGGMAGEPRIECEDREAVLREQVQRQPNPAAYLELLQILEQRLAGLQAGDEQLLLSREVETLWADALTAYPADPLLLLANGDRLFKRGSLQAAWEAYQRGERQAPRDPRWTARLGRLSQQVQDYPNAIARYRESLALAHDAGVVAALAVCHRLNGEPAEALAAWNGALAAHPADPALRMAYGRELYAQGSYGEALAQFQQGSRIDPHSDLFHNRAALCHFQLGDVTTALAEVRQALELRPQAIYYYNLGAGHEALGEPDEAERWYRAGLAKFPGDGQLAQGYGAFLDAHGRGGEALAQIGVPGASGSSSLDYANLAGLAEEQGDLDAAGAAWQAVLAADPNSPVALTAACAFYARIGDRHMLVEQVRLARNRIEPEDFANLLRDVAQAYLALPDYAGGVTAFSELLAVHPDVPMVYNQLGLLQHMAGDSAAGLATVKRGLVEVNLTSLGRYLEAFLTAKVQGPQAALALGPELVGDPAADHGAFELYAGLLLQEQRFAEAEAVAAAGLARHPRRGQLLELRARAMLGQDKLAAAAELLGSGNYARLEFRDKARLLGSIYMELSNYPKAVAAFSDAVQALPADTPEEHAARALAELAEAQHWAGEYAAARSSCTEALALDPRNGAAQVWLGWALLGLDDLNGALQAFDEAQPAAADLETLAWLALGRARCSALSGQRADAFSYWQQARSYSASAASPRLDGAVAATKADLRF